MVRSAAQAAMPKGATEALLRMRTAMARPTLSPCLPASSWGLAAQMWAMALTACSDTRSLVECCSATMRTMTRSTSGLAAALVTAGRVGTRKAPAVAFTSRYTP